MLLTLKRALQLIDVHRKGRWLLLVALAVVAGIFEAGGAILIFGLLQAVTATDQDISIPLLGDTDRFATSSGLTFAVIVISVFFLARGGLYIL